MAEKICSLKKRGSSGGTSLLPNKGDYLYILSPSSVKNGTSITASGSIYRYYIWNIDSYSTLTTTSSNLQCYFSSDGITFTSKRVTSSCDISNYKYAVLQFSDGTTSIS